MARCLITYKATRSLKLDDRFDKHVEIKKGY